MGLWWGSAVDLGFRLINEVIQARGKEDTRPRRRAPCSRSPHRQMPHYNVNDSRGPGQIIIFKAFSFFLPDNNQKRTCHQLASLAGELFGSICGTSPSYTPPRPPSFPPPTTPGEAALKLNGRVLPGVPRTDPEPEHDLIRSVLPGWSPSTRLTPSPRDPPPHCLLPLLRVAVK